jgi:hypothetical protein
MSPQPEMGESFEELVGDFTVANSWLEALCIG